jgi:hypothetical protein
MKILIQLSLLVFIGILTPIFIGLLFLVTPVIWLWRKVVTYISKDTITDFENTSATVNNSSIRERILWSS